jgi:hypothetical protein
MVGAYSMYGETRNSDTVLVRKPNLLHYGSSTCR